MPGLGKTLAARRLAAALGLDFRRAAVHARPAAGRRHRLVRLRPARRRRSRSGPGPVFTGLLLADEINRTPPKTQSALLEAMQERQVTVEGRTYPLPRPFHVLATANPVEYEGTYPLPEAQLDRFLLRLGVGYPDRGRRGRGAARRLAPPARRRDGRAVRRRRAAARAAGGRRGGGRRRRRRRLLRRPRRGDPPAPAVEVGASPRGSLALLLVARALAVLDGRDYVIPEDVKAVAVPALAHRLTLRPETWATATTGAAVVPRRCSTTVPGPATVRQRADRGQRTPPRGPSGTAGPRMSERAAPDACTAVGRSPSARSPSAWGSPPAGRTSPFSAFLCWRASSLAVSARCRRGAGAGAAVRGTRG